MYTALRCGCMHHYILGQTGQLLLRTHTQITHVCHTPIVNVHALVQECLLIVIVWSVVLYCSTRAHTRSCEHACKHALAHPCIPSFIHAHLTSPHQPPAPIRLNFCQQHVALVFSFFLMLCMVIMVIAFTIQSIPSRHQHGV